ncbi:hypothetical protein Taro_004261 [Colocasia esculenta]|uniref:Uncharacterized protein n=1 Tax=Colocasia esculenta TaxID=4460 RepID=A0A843TLK5_COLES|nr:hypothetical protein [Colocasia esculenta]
MAPKKVNSEDIGWQHGTALGSRHNYKYNCCGHTGQGSGVSRLKKYLAGGRLAGYHDVQGCKSMPTEVKPLMVEHLKGVRADTVRKRADKEMQERIMSRRQRDEDDNDEPETYAEHVPDQPLRRTRQQTRVEPWEAEQRGSFKAGSGSGGSGSRVQGEAQRPTIGLVYAKIEAAKKKIREVSPRYAHLVLEVVEDRWDQQMSRDLHMAAYYLHHAYHYAMELLYNDDLTAAFTRVVERLSRSALDAADAIDHMKSFREGVRSFAEPSAIAGRDRIDSDDEDPMVAWVARATTERGEYELDKEENDTEDPHRPNTFLARAVEAAEEEEGEHGDVGQPHSSQFRAEAQDEVGIFLATYE